MFEPEDFVDPRMHEGAVFISRLVGGLARNFIDDYRPLHDDVAFLQVATDMYWSSFQAGYKHTELRAETDLPQAFFCNCPQLYFPTPPLDDEIPAAPPAGSRDMLQFGWYRSVARTGRDPLALRYRFTWTRQSIERTIRSAATHNVVSHLNGVEQSFGFDGDTHVRIAGRDFFGLVAWSTSRRGDTIDPATQRELTYTHRFPGVAVKTVLFRTTLTVGGVSNRGGTAVNVVNPLLEIAWLEPHTNANLHLVYSPQALNSGANGWQAHHQVALFADWGVVYLFGKPKP